MFDKKIHKSLSNELDKVLIKIDKCKQDIEHSAYDVNQDLIKTLNDLRSKRDKIVEDLIVAQNCDAGFFEKLKISAETLIREVSETIDNIIITQKVRDSDVASIEDLLNINGRVLADFHIDIAISKLKSKDDIIRAERSIQISNINSEKKKKYSAGFSVNHVWQDEFRKDLDAGYFDN